MRSQTISIRKLCSLIGKLRSTSPAVIPAPLQLRYLQQECIRAQQEKFHYETLIHIPKEGRLELKWWIQNLEIQKGSPLHLPPPEMIICSDAAKTGGWGAVTLLCRVIHLFSHLVDTLLLMACCFLLIECRGLSLILYVNKLYHSIQITKLDCHTFIIGLNQFKLFVVPLNCMTNPVQINTLLS